MAMPKTPIGPSEVISARRTESLDAPAILKLVQPSTEALFGRVNVVNLIEKAVLAVTLCNDQDEVLGHAAFFDYPNLPNVDSAEWEGWLKSEYGCEKSNALNTLFMHYFVAKPEYSHGCAMEIVRTMFNAVPDLHYCYLVVPTGVYPDHALADIFHMMKPTGSGKASDHGVVFACHRHAHVPVLHVRPASVEDHDDLVPIFNRQSDMLKGAYGDYFLAELIEAQDDNMKCIVAEVDGTAVGFMSINREVKTNLLNECFELAPFHGLCKSHPDDQLEALNTPTSTPQQEPARPGSASSDKSVGSHSSVSSKGMSKNSRQVSNTSLQKPGSGGVVSRPSSKGSVKEEETPVVGRLSDGNESLLSNHSDVESVKSMSSFKDDTHVKPPGTIEAVVPRTPKPPSPRARLPRRFIPTYKGSNAAFAVQLFCIDEKYEMRSCDFLWKAFELFPERDFCIVTVPHLVPEFPLLQQFVRATPRIPSTLSHELYIFSRAGLIRSFTVRTACDSDTAGVEALVKSLDLNENLLCDLKQFNKARRDDDGSEVQAVVAECHKQIVGVAIVRREEDIEYIRSHYNVEDFIYYNHHRRHEHGHLHHYALNPVFRHYAKHFLKEVLRLGHKTCLYYPVYPSYTSADVVSKHSLVAALNDIVPVRARRQIVYPVERLGGNAPSKRVIKTQEAYALNHINRKLTLEPKVTINARIVVVGASDVGVAFLETFAFCPHLRFNNLTLISRHGLPGELPPDELCDQMMASSHCYSEEDYAKLALRTWVNVVFGNMTKINRNKKHVVVNGSTIVPYDHLVLCTGTQYQVQAPTEADIASLVTNSEVPNSPERRLTESCPRNVFIVNDHYEAAVSLYYIETTVLPQLGKVIIYGSSLDTYSCIQALINLGIQGNRIILVQPPVNYETSCFNNSAVENPILDEMKSSGVEIYSGYLLAQWNDGKDGAVVSSASFTSSTQPMRLECCAFFSFYKKMVDTEAFKAINDACLVFDGRLVIDANFHTNDVSIRAAGPLTKYQRSYHADQWTHANFNSKEVGIQMASVMLSLFDPTLEPESEPPQDLLKLIPMYRSPKILAALLPGGFHYLHVAKPGLNTPLDVLMAQNDYGRELVTGKPGGSTEYFRLHINQYGSVETITCLSKKPFPTSNLICLYGLHERYLNNLMSRFEEGLIPDFYSYFQETWSLAIFHDRFPDFRDEVRELLITRPSVDTEALEERVRKLIEEDLTLTKSQRQTMSTEYAKSGAKRAVETRLLSFLSYNYYHMPMYAKPSMV